ncbi:hypothetical protein FRC11_005736 [Ceratobasidium sp. 423]|nr:hypothetical protein FRC11_005736 [Ceratobasidium sp. 423]
MHDLEALMRDAQASEHDHGKGSKPKPGGSNKRVKENGTSKGRGKQKAPIPKSNGFESTYNTDNESSNDDAKTVTTIYDQDDQPGKETDFVKVLKFLEVIVLKLDVALKKEPPINSAQPNQPAHTIIEVTPAGSAPKRDQATQCKENLQPWDGDTQQVLDMRPTDPQQREKEWVVLQGYIHLLIMKALGHPQHKSPLPPGPPPEIDLPTLEWFFINWYKDINDNFNQMVCAIITQQVIEDWLMLFSMSNWDDIFQMVKAHIKYLIKAYKCQELGCNDPSKCTRLLQAAATHRKHMTYCQCLFVTKIVPKLNTHRQLLIDLGIDGTSSNEEDPKCPGHYYVKKIKQLSSNIQELKQLFDHTFETLQQGPGTKGSRGRKHICRRLVSNRKFHIQGLLVNCLNQKWYQKLMKMQKLYYKFAQYKYNFAFPKELTCM